MADSEDLNKAIEATLRKAETELARTEELLQNAEQGRGEFEKMKKEMGIDGETIDRFFNNLDEDGRRWVEEEELKYEQEEAKNSATRDIADGSEAAGKKKRYRDFV